MPRAKKDISKDLMFQKIMPSAAEPSSRRDAEPQQTPPSEPVIPNTAASPQPVTAPQPIQVNVSVLPQEPVAAQPSTKISPAPAPPQPKQPETPVIKEYIPQVFDAPKAQTQSASYTPAAAFYTSNQTASAAVPFNFPVVTRDAVQSYEADTESPLPEGCRLVNLLERPVLEQLESVLSRFNFCKCDICRREIVTAALSSLPAKYVTLEDGEIPPYDKNPETVMEVTTALVRACVKIKNSPPHRTLR